MNRKEYSEYEAHVADFIKREGLSFLSTGTDENMLSEEQGGNVDPWFSWNPCDCCGCGLGGNREYLFARDSEDKLVHFEICTDCVYYINYGRLDDTTMMHLDDTE